MKVFVTVAILAGFVTTGANQFTAFDQTHVGTVVAGSDGIIG